jgi:hypothetical protein
MRILLDAAFRYRDPNQLEEFYGFQVCLRTTEMEMKPEHFGDLVSNGEDGVERGHGFLEDHGDLLTPDLLHLLLRKGEEICPFEEDLTPFVATERGRDQSHNGESGDAFAATGFSNDTQNLASLYLKINPCHGFEGTCRGLKFCYEIDNL